MFLSNSEIEKYTDNLISLMDDLKEYLAEIVIYSKSSVTLNDLYNMSMSDIKIIEKVISKKLKQESNIKQNQYL